MGTPAYANCEALFNKDTEEFLKDLQRLENSPRVKRNTELNKAGLPEGDYEVYDITSHEEKNDLWSVQFTASSPRVQNLDWQIDQLVRLAANHGAVEFSASIYISGEGVYYTEEDMDELRESQTSP